MLTRIRALATVGVLCAALGASAQGPAKATLADFSWLEGKWVAQMGNGMVGEETYSSLAGGVISSMFRLYSGEKTMVLELCTLTQGKEGVELRIRHFDTALTPWEKQDPIVMRLTKWDGKEAKFENFVNSRPKYNTMTRSGPDAMDVHVLIVNDDGSERTIDLAMKRTK